MSLQAGMIKKLEIARESDFGFFLTDNKNEDILLHRREVKGEVAVGDQVEVYLYHDHQGRLAATMEMPIVAFGEVGWLEVVSVRRGHGLFLYNGISRDLFLSMDELDEDRDLWPQVGEKLPVSLTYDKKGRVMARLVKGEPVEKESKRANKSILNTEVSGTVYNIGAEGAFLFTEEGYIAFLHENETNERLRIGKKITARVTFVREDGRINISTKPRKQESQIDDAERILKHLNERDGAMPYWDKSDPEIIKDRFGMSKAGFKRAIGKLMKDNLVYQEEGWTYLKKG
ncbi:S1 RNA-binding domain-containing protein [Anaerobacillus sp. MEB173]|uniref:CvfB family protein n=1 Tax=Anaerobacillus sp. MEB173 TaxID=3383345 RepID=UPI003F914D56